MGTYAVLIALYHITSITTLYLQAIISKLAVIVVLMVVDLPANA
jgi:hypothetical protein